MTTPAKKSPKCPQCQKRTGRKDNSFFPFCSERCKLVDLGKWLDQGYSIPGDPIPPNPEDWQDGH